MTDGAQIEPKGFVQLIGQIAFRSGDNEIVKFRTNRTRWLLGYLAIRLGKDVQRAEIIEAMWPEVGEEVGRNRLSTELSYLRAQIESPFAASGSFLITSRETVRLNAATVSTDLDMVRRALSAARQASQPLSYRIDNFRKVIDACVKPVLEGIDEHWAEAVRQNTNQQIASVAIELNGLLAERRGKGSGVPLLRAALDHLPSSEALHLALIRELVDSRRFEEAIVAFDSYRLFAEAELDGEIDFETEKLLAYTEAGRREQIRRKHVGPIHLTSFVGRGEDVKRLRELVSSQGTCRLVTVLGIGGLGKTRLASAVASDELADGRDVLWVDLVEHTKSLEVLDAIMRSTGTDDPVTVESVIAVLAGRQALLVLDNCEDGVMGFRPTLATILSGAKDLRVLATSRIPFGIEGETPFRLRPLATRARVDSLEKDSSVRLFLDRSDVLRSQGFLTEDFQTIEEICGHLDGIPLAIELVASYTHTLSPRQILNLLGDLQKLNLPGSERRSHRSTMEGALRWSFEQLPVALKRTYRSLGAFHGAFSLEAAAFVSDSSAILDELSSLISAGLVLQEPHATQSMYRLLEPIRQFLTGDWMAEESEKFVQRHATYYSDFALRLAPQTTSRGSVEAFDCLDAEYANLTAAIDSLAERSFTVALDILSRLRYFWNRRHHGRDTLARLQSLLASPGEIETQTLAFAHQTAALLSGYFGDGVGQDEHGGKAWTLHDQLGNLIGMAQLVCMHYVSENVIPRITGKEPYETACDLRDRVLQTDDTFTTIAVSLRAAGLQPMTGGDVSPKLKSLRGILALAKFHGCEWQVELVLVEYAYFCWRVSDFAASVEAYQEAHRLNQRIDGSHYEAPIRTIAALPLIAMGRYAEAKAIFDFEMKRMARLGHMPGIADGYLHRSYLERGEGNLRNARENLLLSLEILTEVELPVDKAIVEANLAILCHLEGSHADARSWCVRSEASFRASTNLNDWKAPLALASARLLLDEGSPVAALCAQVDTPALSESIGDRVGAANVLVTLAIADVAAGRIQEAIECYTVVLEAREAFSFVQYPHDLQWEHSKLGAEVVQASRSRFITLEQLDDKLTTQVKRFRFLASP